MKAPAIFLKNIRQKNNHAFAIEWSDGKVFDYELSELQKNCPCALCVDQKDGKRLLDPSSIKSDVRARKIISVGRYALKIQFTSGCSMGIYSFEMLREFSEGTK